MNNVIAKHNILKQIYELEDNFNVNRLDDCQNLIGLLSVFFLEEELDEDIQASLGIILQRGRNQLDILEEENEECCECSMERDDFRSYENDNRLGPAYIERSHTFTSLLSKRIFDALNPKYHYNVVKKG